LLNQVVIWLGRQDSNLGMAESKSAALPLGYAPLRGADHSGATCAIQRGNFSCRSLAPIACATAAKPRPLI
jgi:hypothetical protein